MAEGKVEARGTTGTPPEPAVEFAALGLGPAALRAVADLGFDVPTAVQVQAIPLLLGGRDLLAEAPTGTGKTAAFGLPIVERLDEDELRTQALVVVPTRELAIQVAEALHGLGKYRQMVTLPVYGGQPYERQFRALARGVQVVVGTPGRLLDHLDRKTLDLDRVRLVVLDEADEMLNMGFLEDVERILGALPPVHQTALFSATLPVRVRTLAKRHLRDPEHMAIGAREAAAPKVRQVYYEMPWRDKPDALVRILDVEEPESAIVFVRTRRDADAVAERLNWSGHIAQAIHGDLNQSQRERVLERFRGGHIQVLVGTDVAARGLDIPDVSHVINYDVPPDADSYVHRVGRTGRAGKAGEAVTLITPSERRQLSLIEHGVHRRLLPLRLPSPEDVTARRRAEFRDELLKVVDAGELDPFIGIIEELAATRDPTELAAAAFKMAAEKRASVERPRESRVARAKPAAADVRERPAAEVAPPRRRSTVAPRRRPQVGTAQIIVHIGRRGGVGPADLVGAIANEAGIPGSDIGEINLYDRFSLIEVPAEVALKVEAALNRTTIRGRRPRASLVVPGGGGPPKARAADR